MNFSSLRFLPFIIFGVVLLFGGHYLIFRTLTKVFHIGKLLKSVITAFFVVLPLAFFASALLGHFSQDWLSRLVYFISVSWLGLALNLLLAAIVINFFFGLMNLARLNFNRQLFTVGLLAIAVIFSVYGFWNAFHPRVKNIEVKIKNLPAVWQNKTIVHLSDVHLGRIYGVDFLRNIVAQVNAQDPDLVLITGDLFDGMDGGLNDFVESLNNLRAKEGIFFVTGNHEAYVGIEAALAVLRQTKIRRLTNEAVNIDGLQIVGLDYALTNDSTGLTGRSDDEEKTIRSLPGFDRTRSSILMYHAPVNVESAAKAGINLQLSGHSHNGQLWPLNFFTWLIYGRYDYGLKTLGDFMVYTTSGIGTWGPPMRTGNTPEIPVFRISS